jgi:RNA polymerase primary sigma factor
MKKNKKTKPSKSTKAKKKIVKTKTVKVAKKLKKIKPVLAMKAVKESKPLKKADKVAQSVNKLLSKGKEKGFVTYDDILKEFPTVEEDVLFLEDLYEKFSSQGIDILEGGGLLDTDDLLGKDLYDNKFDINHDSIQIYLKEIGQYPLISGSQERELAKRIQKGTRML